MPLSGWHYIKKEIGPFLVLEGADFYSSVDCFSLKIALTRAVFLRMMA